MSMLVVSVAIAHPLLSHALERARLEAGPDALNSENEALPDVSQSAIDGPPGVDHRPMKPEPNPQS